MPTKKLHWRTLMRHAAAEKNPTKKAALLKRANAQKRAERKDGKKAKRTSRPTPAATSRKAKATPGTTTRKKPTTKAPSRPAIKAAIPAGDLEAMFATHAKATGWKVDSVAPAESRHAIMARSIIVTMKDETNAQHLESMIAGRLNDLECAAYNKGANQQMEQDRDELLSSFLEQLNHRWDGCTGQYISRATIKAIRWALEEGGFTTNPRRAQHNDKATDAEASDVRKAC